MDYSKIFWGNVLLLFLFLCGCNTENKNTAIIKKWIGKEILFPQKIEWKILGRDTVCSDLLNYSYKIFVYQDSANCMPCNFHALEWKSIIEDCNKKNIDISFLFILQSSDYKEIEVNFILNDFYYPVVYDKKKEFDKLNKFPRESVFQTFLLDKNNKVLLIGSPTNNPKIWELYKKMITQTQ